MQETQVQSLGQEDPLEEEMATYFSILACRILWLEDPGRWQSMGAAGLDTTEYIAPSDSLKKVGKDGRKGTKIRWDEKKTNHKTVGLIQ